MPALLDTTIPVATGRRITRRFAGWHAGEFCPGYEARSKRGARIAGLWQMPPGDLLGYNCESEQLEAKGKMRIVDLHEKPDLIPGVARLLFEGFAEQSSGAWPTDEAALEEVRESLDPDRISLVALDEEGRAIGWIGGISHYGGHAWELHPLVVDPSHRRRGVGRALVADLEEHVRLHGATTLWLGTDDESGQTSLAGVDLYPNVWEHVRGIRNLKGHPFSFYEKVGFAIVGVLPDANGPGKPDILMAKRVVR